MYRHFRILLCFDDLNTVLLQAVWPQQASTKLFREVTAMASGDGDQDTNGVNSDKNSDEEGTSQIQGAEGAEKDAAKNDDRDDGDDFLKKFQSWLKVPKEFGEDYANFVSALGRLGDAEGVKLEALSSDASAEAGYRPVTLQGILAVAAWLAKDGTGQSLGGERWES